MRLCDKTEIKIDERYSIVGEFEDDTEPFDIENVSGRVLADFLKTLLTDAEIDG